MTTQRQNEIEAVAVRMAHEAWDGGGDLERVSGPASERYQPKPIDVEDAEYRVGAMTPDEREVFDAVFAARAAEIHEA